MTSSLPIGMDRYGQRTSIIIIMLSICLAAKYLVIAEVFAKYELVDSNCCEVHSVLSLMLKMLSFYHCLTAVSIQQ